MNQHRYYATPDWFVVIGALLLIAAAGLLAVGLGVGDRAAVGLGLLFAGIVVSVAGAGVRQDIAKLAREEQRWLDKECDCHE